MKQQRCESEQFIVIIDDLKRFAGIFISNGKNGKESKTAERQRERERERVCVQEAECCGERKIGSAIK